ncbi:MAG: HD domain-containing protein [Bacteroidales bacterium]|nr:HD domain-containing protein [Bacteroidales bacterium]
MNKRKIINDPVFGFINLPTGFLYEVYQHPYLHRLTRIKQLGMSSFVYPGAQHTRFLHTTGAMYLMMEAVQHLKNKGHQITTEEAEGVIAAILLHDLGHGPFSHALEHVLIPEVSHETISLLLMERMNHQFNGRLDVAISIFKDEYPKRFLHQLVSGNLDMDRLDYLRRDSFFTGVSEGNIGSARIIKMLNVVDDRLVVEAKGIYSIENYLMSRSLMYWQVYLHKTSLAAEKMLENLILRARHLIAKGVSVPASPAFSHFLSTSLQPGVMDDTSLDHFINLDDTDIWTAIKAWQTHDDFILSLLSKGLIDRRLFKMEMTKEAPTTERLENDITTLAATYGISQEDARFLTSLSMVTTNMYNAEVDSIDILYNDGLIRPITTASDMLNLDVLSKEVCKYAYCHVRIK